MDDTQRQAFRAFIEDAPLHTGTCDAFLAGWEACRRHYDGIKTAPQAGHTMCDTIYSAYPRKVGRADALKAIEKAVARSGLGGIEMLNRVTQYAEATKTWPAADRQFIPHPATWFNRGSYDDDPKEWLRGVAGGVGIKVSA